jgi:uncharacterized membrane protein YjjP (DUF1212 family)
VTYDQLTLVIRAAAAVVWTGVLVLIATNTWDSTYLRRVLVTASLVIVLWALVLGSLVQFGLVGGDVARIIYTAIATVLLIVGGVLLITAQDLP